MTTNVMYGQVVRIEVDGKTLNIQPRRKKWWETWKAVLANFKATNEWPDTDHPVWGKWVNDTRLAFRRLAEDERSQLKRHGFPTAIVKRPPGAAGTAERLQKLLARLENGGTMSDHDRAYLNPLHVVNKLPDTFRQRLLKLNIAIK